MTDNEARRVLWEWRDGWTCERREALIHVVQALEDRALLVAALDHTTIQAVGYSRAGDMVDIARRHMRGDP